MKKTFYLALIISIYACNEVDCNKTNMKIFYLPQDTDSITRIDCDLIDSGLLHNKVLEICDKGEIMEIISIIYKLEKHEIDEPIDARIKINLNNENENFKICLGEYFGLTINGVRYKDSKVLLNKVKSKIYE